MKTYAPGLWLIQVSMSHSTSCCIVTVIGVKRDKTRQRRGDSRILIKRPSAFGLVTQQHASAKKGFSPGATVVASRRKRCALRFLLASTAHTWSHHPGCAQEPPEQHHMNGIHLLHLEGQLCTWYTRRHPGNQPIRGTYWATN